MSVLALGVANAPATSVASDLAEPKRFTPAASKVAPGTREADLARSQLGVPYRSNGASPQTGFDCSGLVQYVYAELGVALPHSSGARWRLGRAVGSTSLVPGDLIFFDGQQHVGIYVGNAPHTGARVRVDPISSWYGATLDGARRIV